MTFLRPFLRGLASLLDLGGVLRPWRPITRTPEKAARLDAEVIASDWRAVGDDLRTAAGKAGDPAPSDQEPTS